MTNTPQGDGADPTRPMGPSYPAYNDPAYAGQSPSGPGYQAPQPPDPTRQLPPYSPYGYDQYGTGQYNTGQYGPPYPRGEPPEGPPSPKSPRWLWVAAAVAVLLVVGLVIALVVVNSGKQDTVVAPPPMPEPTSTASRPPSTTTTLRPLPPIVPVPTPSTPPSTSAAPGATESVGYQVTGTGRAINITYVDTGQVLQTEFNVVLPWSKQVQLPSPASDSASVTIVNVGPQVSCSVTINGVQVQSNTGSGLTICAPTR